MLRCFISPVYDMYLMPIYLHHLSWRGQVFLFFLESFPMLYIRIDKHAAKYHNRCQQDYSHSLKDHFSQFLSLFILFLSGHRHTHRLWRLFRHCFRDHFHVVFLVSLLISTHTCVFTSVSLLFSHCVQINVEQRNTIYDIPTNVKSK